jgi:hypothetical protein
MEHERFIESPCDTNVALAIYEPCIQKYSREYLYAFAALYYISVAFEEILV